MNGVRKRGHVTCVSDGIEATALPPACYACVCARMCVSAESCNDGEQEGWAAVTLAAREGHDDILALLLHHKADINAFNHVSEPPPIPWSYSIPMIIRDG